MCGIAGYWSDGYADPDIAEQMADRITNRGSDDQGVWTDQDSGLALAHRRLSILDLSPAGHQPMCSPCNRYVLVYNGEIYNHQELRAELYTEGGHFDWRGHSDTETLLAALSHWGIQDTLIRLNGMFAFALWDRKEQTLFLARDRMGEKPLYYGKVGNTFLFGSELKALAAHPHWKGDIDRDALALYMRYKYVPSPWSIYQGIAKLPPAHFVVIRGRGMQAEEPQCYWDLGHIAELGTSTVDPRSSEELTHELDRLLSDAVGRRMTADVPLGAFLSGGVDSSTVAALMQAQSKQPIKTFSIGFEEEGYNEAEHAKRVAEHLGTDHTELYVTAQQAMAVIPKLPTIYDEPFAGSSQIPTYLVSQLAHEQVKVSLSGDGGDELFAGYNRHVVGPAIWNRLAWLPWPVRRTLGKTVALIAQGDTSRLARLLSGAKGIPKLGHKLDKLASALQAKDSIAFYKDLVSLWKQPSALVLGSREPATLVDQPEKTGKLPGLLEQMMLLDMLTYMPEEILTKVDRASMAVSLEAREPLLDHRVVEFAWQVPSKYKQREGQSKWLLRQVLYHYVPRKLIDRPKMGFGVPIEHWLRGPLRDWAEALLDEDRLRREGYFDPAPIRKMWNEYLKGKQRSHYDLWAVLMFQAWLESGQNLTD